MTPKDTDQNSSSIPASKKWTIMSVVFLVTVGIDQLSKVWAIAALKGQPARTYFGDFARLQYSENPGAFLSLGDSLSPEVRFWLFNVAVTIGLGACVYYLVRTRTITLAHLYGFSLLTSGGFSNLLDRVFRTGGFVVDFLNVGIFSLRTGIFNIADMAIMAGVFFVVLPKPADGTAKKG